MRRTAGWPWRTPGWAWVRSAVAMSGVRHGADEHHQSCGEKTARSYHSFSAALAPGGRRWPLTPPKRAADRRSLVSGGSVATRAGQRERGQSSLDVGSDGFGWLIGVHRDEDASFGVVGDERARRLGE